MLVLTDRQVEELVAMSEAVDAVERAFRDLADGRAQMPPKVYLDFPQFEGDLRVMPAAIGNEFAGVKLVNSHPGNPARGLATVAGTYLLFSQETGLPLCLMGATALTGIRTGAGSAVATRYLAPAGSNSLGLIGAGVQARYQAEAIAEVAPFEHVSVWAPEFDRERRDLFLQRMRTSLPSADWQPAASIQEAAAAHIVCTTTPSRSPIVSQSHIGPGTHINAIGADAHGKQELDPQILRKALVIVDDMHQAESGGEINVPLASGLISRADIAGSLADLVAGNIPGRTSDEQITVFDSTGLAIQDIALASTVYTQALQAGVGSEVDL